MRVCGLCSHEGPVWQVAWAHPMFGNILASCSYDRKVIIWKEENGSWDKMYEYTGHESSGRLFLTHDILDSAAGLICWCWCYWSVSTVNSVCWGPYDFGLILACGSSDGAISLLTFTGDQQWEVKKINNAHTVSLRQWLTWYVNVFTLILNTCVAALFVNSMVTFLQIGCNAVSWAPAVVPGSLIDQPSGQKPNYVKRFVSGGCDNLVKLWK